MKLRILASTLGAAVVMVGFAATTPTVASATPITTTTPPAGTQAPATCSGNDVLLLIDQSASLKKSDPQHQRVDAAQQLITSLAKAATPASPITVSIAGFGTTVDEPDPYQLPADEAQAAKRLERLPVTPRDKNTDYILALQRAASYMSGLPADHCRSVLLFTDGAYDIDDPAAVASYTSLKDPEEINADLGNQVCGPRSPESLLTSSISEQLNLSHINLTLIDLQTDDQDSPERKNTGAVLDRLLTNPDDPCRVPGEWIPVGNADQLSETFTQQAKQIFDAQQAGSERSLIDCTTLAHGLPAGAVRSVAALAADPADPVTFRTPDGDVSGPVHDFGDAERTVPGQISLAEDPSTMHSCYATIDFGVALDGDPHVWSNAESTPVSFVVGGPQSAAQPALSLDNDAVTTSATVGGVPVATTWDPNTRRWMIDVPGPYSSPPKLHIEAHLVALDPASGPAPSLDHPLKVDQEPPAPSVSWIGRSTQEGSGAVDGALQVTPAASINGQVCIQFPSTTAAVLDEAGTEVGTLSLHDVGEACRPDDKPFDVPATLDVDRATNAGASSTLPYSLRYVDAHGKELADTSGTVTAAIVLSKPADTGRLIVVALLLVLGSLVVPTGVLWLLARRQSRLPDPSTFIVAGVPLTTNDNGALQTSGTPLQIRDLHAVRGSRNRFELSESTAIRRHNPRHPFASLSAEAVVADGTVDAVPHMGTIGRNGRRRHLPARFRNVVVVHHNAGTRVAEGFVIVPRNTTPSAAADVLQDALTKLNRGTRAPAAAQATTVQAPATPVEPPRQHQRTDPAMHPYPRRQRRPAATVRRNSAAPHLPRRPVVPRPDQSFTPSPRTHSMLRKFLFIGLGGSGGKTLRYLRHDLEQWLDQIGWKKPFPTGWQMLHIDTPTDQDGTEITEVKPLPAENYLGLVMPGIEFGAVASKLTAMGDEAWRELASWRVDPTFLQVPITTGAGQFRAVGRTIGLAYAGKILEALRAAQIKLNSASANSELSEIHQLAYGTQADTPIEPVAIVVSSLSGGTGAGLLLDTCDLLRQLPGTWANHSFGMLYASDVFRHLGDMAIAGVQPNSLSALSEVMNGYWLTSNSPRASALFQIAGAPKPLAKSGPAFPFLIGAANTKGVTFGDQRAVYQMMGRALRSWTTDPAVQVQLIEYTKANWQNTAAGNAVKANVVMRDHQPVFEAFGYAEVTLGVDRLHVYASQRLAKQAATWLWDGHMQSARQIDPNDARTAPEIIEDQARQHMAYFLDQSGLNERGDSHNQIIDALHPEEAEVLLEVGVGDVTRLTTEGIHTLGASEWTTRIMAALPGAAEEYERAYDERLRARVRDWVDRVPERVIEVVTASVARVGLPVTARIVELVVDELGSVASELAEEAQEYRRWSADARGAVIAQLSINGKIPAGHPAVAEAMHHGMWHAGGYQGEAKRRQIARQLIDEFANDFLTPLARALSHASSELNIVGFRGDGINAPVIPAWPDGPVTDEMWPPANEQVVIPLETFPTLFDDLLRRSTKADRPGDSIVEARTQVIDASFVDDAEAGTKVASPLSIRSTWTPDPALLLGGAAPRSAATFDAAFSPRDLRDRATAWLVRQGTAFERFLSTDLRSYLDDDPLVDPAEVGDRRSNFRSAFAEALDSAEPLVQIDPALLALLHQTNEIPRRAVPGLLPFHDHPVEGSVREILASKLGGLAAGAVSFTTAPEIRRISITSTLGAAHDPLVFASITQPIVAGWNAAAQSAPARTNFWNNRRARPLTEFVPVSQEILLAMTRGWFTGVLLGHVDTQKRAISHDGGPAFFPPTLLREPGDLRDVLPVLLESMPLAYIEVARQQSLEPLDAYLALRDLGVQPGLPSFESAHIYDRLNATFDHWLRSGDAGTTLELGLIERSKQPTDTPEQRRDAALALVRKSLGDYRELLGEYAKRGRQTPTALGPAYGIWPGMAAVIEQALTDLQVALERADLRDDDLAM